MVYFAANLVQILELMMVLGMRGVLVGAKLVKYMYSRMEQSRERARGGLLLEKKFKEVNV